MDLPLDDPAIMTAVFIGTPIVLLAAVTNPLEFLVLNQNGRVLLSPLNLFGPALDHLLALVSHKLLFHV